MIATVDKNEDWKINYSEFRVSIYVAVEGVRYWHILDVCCPNLIPLFVQVMLGAFPLVLPDFLPVRANTSKQENEFCEK